MQVVFVVVAELSFPQDAPLPDGEVRCDVGEQAEAIIGRHDWHADHIAEGDEHEETIHRGPHLDGLLGVLVNEHAVQELADGLLPASRRAIGLGAGGGCVLSSQTAVMILVTIVMGWFAAGSIWNVRKGKAVLRWMHGGLPLLGERTTVRWLGTTSVEMVIAKARKPFDQATIVLFFEPRDVPWIWGPSRLRGRRDTLIVRARLAKTPTADLEAIDVASWSGREARPRITGERWELREPAGTEPL